MANTLPRCHNIYIDADACPNTVREITIRAATRLQVPLIFVANQARLVPKSALISFIQVDSGFNVADQKIIDLVLPGDLVITADIPLADAVIKKQAYALNPRGELYHANNIKEILSMRNFMEEMRSTGQQLGGPAPLNPRDKQKFANTLDKFLAAHCKN